MIHTNNKQILDSMLRKNNLNSGRNRNQVNSTTIRQTNDSSVNGRVYIKKALSPSFDHQNGPPSIHSNHSNQQSYKHQRQPNKQQSSSVTKKSQKIGVASNLVSPVSSRSNRPMGVPMGSTQFMTN